MKQGFKFNNGKTAYSVDGLCRLCQEEGQEALYHLENGHIEQWLDYIGEKKLANLAYLIRNRKVVLKQNKITRLVTLLRKYGSEYREFSQDVDFLDFLDRNKSIDILLKEYETLRNEILNILQNRTQIIVLGLAAIFTLVGLGLAPLTDFFTADKITLHGPVSATLEQPNISDNTLALDIKSDQKVFIEKTIKQDTIAEAAIPTIIIFSWLIPMGSILIMYFSLNWSQQIITIGEYISCKIEKKIINLIKGQFYSSKLSREVKFLATPLSWESYMKTEPRSNDVAGFTFITILFTFITILSIGAASLILYFDWESGTQKAVIKINNLWEMSWTNLASIKGNWTTHLPLVSWIFIVGLLILFFSNRRINFQSFRDNWQRFKIWLFFPTIRDRQKFKKSILSFRINRIGKQGRRAPINQRRFRSWLFSLLGIWLLCFIISLLYAYLFIFPRNLILCHDLSVNILEKLGCLFSKLIEQWFLYSLLTIFTALILIPIIIILFTSVLNRKQIERFRQHLFSDLNLLWFIPLFLIIYLFAFYEFTGIYKQEIKSFWLFIFPVLIWTICLVKTWHQYLYTLNIRNKTKTILQKAEYLKDLWQ